MRFIARSPALLKSGLRLASLDRLLELSGGEAGFLIDVQRRGLFRPTRSFQNRARDSIARVSRGIRTVVIGRLVNYYSGPVAIQKASLAAAETELRHEEFHRQWSILGHMNIR